MSTLRTGDEEAHKVIFEHGGYELRDLCELDLASVHTAYHVGNVQQTLRPGTCHVQKTPVEKLSVSQECLCDRACQRVPFFFSILRSVKGKDVFLD